MATRSFISIKTGKNFRTIRCHYDGYPECNGAILLKYYNSLDRVEALLQLGDLSSLHKDIAPKAGETHTFYEKAKDVVVALHRDRGDKYYAPKKHGYKGFEYEDYNYVFNATTNTWFVKPYNRKWQPLAKVIAAINPDKLFA